MLAQPAMTVLARRAGLTAGTLTGTAAAALRAHRLPRPVTLPSPHTLPLRFCLALEPFRIFIGAISYIQGGGSLPSESSSSSVTYVLSPVNLITYDVSPTGRTTFPYLIPLLGLGVLITYDENVARPVTPAAS